MSVLWEETEEVEEDGDKKAADWEQEWFERTVPRFLGLGAFTVGGYSLMSAIALSRLDLACLAAVALFCASAFWATSEKRSPPRE